MGTKQNFEHSNWNLWNYTNYSMNRNCTALVTLNTNLLLESSCFLPCFLLCYIQVTCQLVGSIYLRRYACIPLMSITHLYHILCVARLIYYKKCFVDNKQAKRQEVFGPTHHLQWSLSSQCRQYATNSFLLHNGFIDSS